MVITAVAGPTASPRLRILISDHRTADGAAVAREFSSDEESPSPMLTALIASRRPLLLESPDCEWPMEGMRPATRAFLQRTSVTGFLIVPVLHENEVVGTLGCWREVPPEPFTAADGRTMEHLARLVAPTLAMLRRDGETGRQAPEYEPSLGHLFSVANELLFTSTDGRFTLLNPAWERTLGWSREELMARPLIDFVHPEDREPTLAEAARVAEPGHETIGFENRYRHRDGSFRRLRWQAVADGRHWYGAARDVTEERRAEEALGSTARARDSVVEAALDCIVTMDHTGHVLEFNPAAQRVFGYPREAALGREVAELIIPKRLREGHRNALARLAEGEPPRLIGRRMEFTAVRRDGTELPVELSITRTDDTPPRYIGFMRDLSYQRTATRVAQANEERFRQIVETSAEGVWTLDLRHRTTFANPAMARMLGYLPEEMAGRPAFDFMDEPEARRAARHLATEQPGGPAEAFEGRLKHRDGSDVWTEHRVTSLRDDNGTQVGRLAMVTDVTERRGADHRRQLLAAIVDSSDDAILAKTLDGVVTAWNPGAERLYGWTQAEALGKRVADLIVPARGRSEEEWITERVGRGEAVERYETERCRRDGRRVPVSVTASALRDRDGRVVGVAVIARDITERKAHEEDLRRQVQAAAWVGRIRDALDEDRLVLWGQPIINLQTGETEQEELLLRMVDRGGEIVPPGAFLPAAESFGLIQEIDIWVIQEAARRASTGLCVEVNLSAQSVGHPGLLEEVERALEEHGADPGNIVFEITETALMERMESGADFARRLSELGCRFALDDFGTGFGSFTYLKNLPVDFLKIDIEFVRDLVTDPSNEHVVRAVVNLAKGFGQKTVAEGVEDEETRELLRNLGVDYAQGYHLGRPAPLVEPAVEGGS